MTAMRAIALVASLSVAALVSARDGAAPDFRNFTYPWPKYLEHRVPAIRLRSGRMPERPNAKREGPPGDRGADLTGVAYADVTGDGRREALVVINLPMYGHGWGINLVYVYDLRGRTPRLLDRFVDGDRSSGGLRDVYAVEGDLVLEFWGDAEGKSAAACCAEAYTRRVLRWNGRRFRLSSERVLPNPSGQSLDGLGEFRRLGAP